MRSKIVMYCGMVGCFLLAGAANAQERTEMNKTEEGRIDSLDAAYKQAEESVEQKAADEASLSELKDKQKKAKVKAKEAQRVENDASDAEQASRSAFKAERKAQKMRERADGQAEKAKRARSKSDANQRR